MNNARPTIALVDDHPMFRDAAKLILTSQGFDIILEAANGKELIDQLPTIPQLPEIFLLDIDMPVMNGYDTARYLREHYPSAKIVAFGLFLTKTKETRMFESGADRLLRKESSHHQWKKELLDIYRNARRQ